MLYPALASYFDRVCTNDIPPDRQMILGEIIDYIKKTDDVRLNFICTHNSRRSLLGQVWAQTFAHYYGVAIESFSGGTEATAFHPNAVEALERVGFGVEKESGENPIYRLSYASEVQPIVCFSKTYDDEVNPRSNYLAVMTCSEADAECPVVFGATARIKLLYEDPKVADGTERQASVYDERCAQIANEMNFVFSQI